LGGLLGAEGPKFEAEVKSRRGVLPLPSSYRVWRSAVSSPSGVRGRTPTANTFWTY